MKFFNYINTRLLPVINDEYCRAIRLYKNPSKVKKECIILCLFIKNLYPILQVLSGKKLAISYVELVVTTKCSLRCKYCSNLIQYYDIHTKKPYDSKLNKNILAINKLLTVVNVINEFCVLGGEPFLYQDLFELLRYLLSRNEIKNIVITTNGTIIPNDDLIHLLQNKRFCVRISNYGNKSKHLHELKKTLKSNHIRFQEVFHNSEWADYGGLTPRNRGVDELKKQFGQCATSCRSLLNGKLHTCFRSSHGMDLGFIRQNHKDYVDLLDQNLTSKELIIQVEHIVFGKDYIDACNYCDFGVFPIKWVTPGLQVGEER
ncbi:MAG: radical SAM protein [Lachnospiraceae bacterium]|jgi:molybdenum cofactor biosynthesis enzyme MoaA|nr:radical SAM protein [Lachnospiraceae bacterium]